MKTSLPPELIDAISADLSAIKDKSVPIRLYAAAERVRRKFVALNIALEDIAENFVDLANVYNIAFVIDLADAEDAGALSDPARIAAAGAGSSGAPQ